MTVVVTGASGHLGANLVRELVARGEQVRVLVHHDTRALEGLPVERARGDVCEPATLEPAFRGAQVVYHLASVISIDGDRGGRVTSVNIEGARNVAAAAQAAGVGRLVHCSSIHAFQQAPLDEPLDESRARVPNDRGQAAYDRSKAAGEAAVREVIAQGLDAVIVHPSAFIGPWDVAPSRVGRVLLDLYHRRLPTLVPGGFDWVDVRDVVSGVLAAAAQGRRGESYLLSGHWHSVAELAAMAQEVTGVKPPRLTSPMWLARVGAPFVTLVGRLRDREPLYTRESLQALRSNRTIVRAKAAHDLGYDPRPVKEAVAAAYEWFRGAGYLEGTAGAGGEAPAG